jgi:NAD(P)H dehydrogenase (quinone)
VILVTGATGKTGQHIIRALVARNCIIRGLTRRSEQTEKLLSLGTEEVVCGDLRDPQMLQAAFQGANAVYHIAPNMSPDELAIGEAVIKAALHAKVEHFVFHSVLHPQIEDMPHHWLKMRVEEALIKSGLNFTILQPAAYMQNLLGYREAIINQGFYTVPFSLEARQNMVDLNDVAEAAARVLTESGHYHATYELVGIDAPNAIEIAAAIGKQIGSPVIADQMDRSVWESRARENGLAEYAVQSLLKMFAYYEQFQFLGNPNALRWLLGREPIRLTEFLDRHF